MGRNSLEAVFDPKTECKWLNLAGNNRNMLMNSDLLWLTLSFSLRSDAGRYVAVGRNSLEAVFDH